MSAFLASASTGGLIGVLDPWCGGSSIGSCQMSLLDQFHAIPKWTSWSWSKCQYQLEPKVDANSLEELKLQQSYLLHHTTTIDILMSCPNLTLPISVNSCEPFWEGCYVQSLLVPQHVGIVGVVIRIKVEI